MGLQRVTILALVAALAAPPLLEHDCSGSKGSEEGPEGLVEAVEQVARSHNDGAEQVDQAADGEQAELGCGVEGAREQLHAGQDDLIQGGRHLAQAGLLVEGQAGVGDGLQAGGGAGLGLALGELDGGEAVLGGGVAVEVLGRGGARGGLPHLLLPRRPCQQGLVRRGGCSSPMTQTEGSLSLSSSASLVRSDLSHDSHPD